MNDFVSSLNTSVLTEQKNLQRKGQQRIALWKTQYVRGKLGVYIVIYRFIFKFYVTAIFSVNIRNREKFIIKN